MDVVNDAIADARSICMRECGDAPEVIVHAPPNTTFAYVPSHIHHMVRSPFPFKMYNVNLDLDSDSWTLSDM